MSTTVRALALPSGFVSKPENVPTKPEFEPTMGKCHGPCRAAFKLDFLKYHPRVSALACKSCYTRLDAQVAAAANGPRRKVRGIGSGSKGPNQSAAARAARRAERTECPKGPGGQKSGYKSRQPSPQKAGMLKGK